MQMLALLCDILKTAGIILVCIILFVLFLLLLVLFCPWRYTVDMKKEEQLTGKITVSWLLHFLAAEVIYQGSVNLRFRVLGIPIYDKNRKEKKEEKAVKEAEITKTPELKAAEADSFSLSPATDEKEKSFTKDDGKDRAAPEKEDKNVPKRSKQKTWWEFPQYFFELLTGWMEKLADWLLNLPWLIDDFLENTEEKISSVTDTVEYYTGLFQKRGSKWVIDYLKKEIFFLLRHIAPKHSKINIFYTDEDPAKVADMMAYYGMAMPFLPKHSYFNAELGESKLEGNIRIRGRIFLIVILWHGIKLYFNKKVRIFLKLIKREAG